MVEGGGLELVVKGFRSGLILLRAESVHVVCNVLMVGSG